LAARIEQCIANPAVLDEMGANAQAWVREQLSPERHYERLRVIYQDAIVNRQHGIIKRLL
jgi:glycosyltransferase involved in cell wall biosynthesis